MRARVASMLFLASCASHPPPKAEAPPPASKPARAAAPSPEVRIVEPAFGKEHSAKAGPLLVPFGVNQNGTVLVLALVERAAMEGAAYLGDMQLVVTFRYGGTAVECRSKVLFEGDPSLAPRPVAPPAEEANDAYGTEVEKFRPQRVKVTADENELYCTSEMRQVVGPVSYQGDRTAAESGRLADRPAATRNRADRTVTAETVDWCELQRVKRPAERYDYEVKLGFVPPNWDYISARYADRKLVQGTPSCYSIDNAELAGGPIYRLTATAYYKGAVAQRPPAEPPSGGITDMLLRRETTSPAIEHQRCKELGRKDCAGGIDPGQTDPEHGWYREH